MTAEVAILNRQAVAMAADSAVTVSGPGGPKIFNTVNKLFALSKYHPVGIMIYSSAEIMNTPVETVIKNYRRELNDKYFDTIDDYCKSFISYLTDNISIFPNESRIKHTESLFNHVMIDIWQSINYYLNENYQGWGIPTG